MVRGDTTGATVQVRRRVSARAEQIFDLWTKPDLMVRWMSPFRARSIARRAVTSALAEPLALSCHRRNQAARRAARISRDLSRRGTR